MPCIGSGFDGDSQGCSGVFLRDKPEAKPKGIGSCLGLRRATGSADLAWLLGVSALSPNPM